jgi:RHS repeat-associated protein
MWMQIGVVALLLVNGVQTALHFYSSRVAQTAPASSPQNLSRFEYTYQPDRLISAAPQARNAYDPYGTVRALSSGSQLATFQYSGYFAHAPSAVSVMPMRAYDVSAGRWTERDPLPAK